MEDNQSQQPQADPVAQVEQPVVTTEQPAEQPIAEVEPVAAQPEAPVDNAEQSQNVQDTITPEQKFLNGFQQLVDETGHTFTVEPTFIKRDDGTWSIGVKTQVSLR